MKWFAAVLVAMLTVTATEVGSVTVTFLNADGNKENAFDEGETVICRCRADYTDAPFTSAIFEWKRHRSETRQPVTDGEQIIAEEDGDRFSAANLTDIGNNVMDYRLTIGNVDRYDNGFRFYCEFFKTSGESSGAGGLAAQMTVNWNPPSAQCTDIPAKVKNGDTLSYQCSTVDADVKSNGSLSLWKNGKEIETASVASPATPTGTRHEISHASTVTDVKDVVMCRYRGTGGFEEYITNCTFNQPNCIVDDVGAPCPVGGAMSPRDRVQIMTILGLATFVMFWVQTAGV